MTSISTIKPNEWSITYDESGYLEIEQDNINSNFFEKIIKAIEVWLGRRYYGKNMHKMMEKEGFVHSFTVVTSDTNTERHVRTWAQEHFKTYCKKLESDPSGLLYKGKEISLDNAFYKL